MSLTTRDLQCSCVRSWGRLQRLTESVCRIGRDSRLITAANLSSRLVPTRKITDCSIKPAFSFLALTRNPG
ncbi:hypothetical protein CANCADRAFT_32391 [Tortispora caseinolytica NRRL Y-17796]|uniref:Uncharacterized protein n=1 Tax=Tortispora caseinolytica NRRL Y-17796 TaxID=767744 RepID=A0A1E4TB34_9ASCO|nr:hypothetical protein CANCADRAFT_32391 [Tortispora caseinolytica NRRL Y-17796]